MEEEMRALLELAVARGVGEVPVRQLLERFGDGRTVLARLDEVLMEDETPKRLGNILEEATRRRADTVRRRVEALGLGLLGWGQAGYPARLAPLGDAPAVLYRKGLVDLHLERPVVAIVGSRTPTPYGVRVARELATGLAARGAVVVSGLARGVDSHAHLGALEAGGRTVAVLAGGLDRIYPPQHLPLAERIEEKGMLLTEFPPGGKLSPGQFPRRNRIISGVSDLVVVVQAARRSGALITAAWALDQGREVAAVPGSIHSPMSDGPHDLLRDGAWVADSPQALLALLSGDPVPVTAGLEEKGREGGRLLQALHDHDGCPERAARSLGLDPRKVAIRLTRLEIEGRVRREGEGRFFPVSAG